MRRGRFAGLLVVPLVALLLAGCSDDDDDNEPAGDGTLSVIVDWKPKLAPIALTWTVTVVNDTDEDVELEFTTGQRADVILTRDGEDVYQWSRALVFTQVIGHVEVPAGESHDFTLDEPALDVDPGDYRLTAVVTAASHDLRTTRQVTVGHR